MRQLRCRGVRSLWAGVPRAEGIRSEEISGASHLAVRREGLCVKLSGGLQDDRMHMMSVIPDVRAAARALSPPTTEHLVGMSERLATSIFNLATPMAIDG